MIRVNVHALAGDEPGHIDYQFEADTPANDHDESFQLLIFQILSLDDSLTNTHGFAALNGNSLPDSDALTLLDYLGREIKNYQDLVEIAYVNTLAATQGASDPEHGVVLQADIWCVSSLMKATRGFCTSHVFLSEGIIQPCYTVLDLQLSLCTRCRPLFDHSMIASYSASGQIELPSIKSFVCDCSKVLEMGISAPAVAEQLIRERSILTATGRRNSTTSNSKPTEESQETSETLTATAASLSASLLVSGLSKQTLLYLKRKLFRESFSPYKSILRGSTEQQQMAMQFRARVQSGIQIVKVYEDPMQQYFARAVVDYEVVQRHAERHLEECAQKVKQQLHDQSNRKQQQLLLESSVQRGAQRSPTPALSLQTSPEEAFVIGLLRWFKGEFFQWCNKPQCANPLCEFSSKPGGRMDGTGATLPSPQEKQIGWAGRVELYSCAACKEITRLPRFNNPAHLLTPTKATIPTNPTESHSSGKVVCGGRRGRCGEFANAFCLICRALSLDARYVMDFTDHVWVEVWIPSLQRFVHADPCEKTLDKPLMYEKGWNKKLSHILSFSRYGVEDVSPRYSRKLSEVILRRCESVVHESYVGDILQAADVQLLNEYEGMMRQQAMLRPLSVASDGDPTSVLSITTTVDAHRMASGVRTGESESPRETRTALLGGVSDETGGKVTILDALRATVDAKHQHALSSTTADGVNGVYSAAGTAATGRAGGDGSVLNCFHQMAAFDLSIDTMRKRRRLQRRELEGMMFLDMALDGRVLSPEEMSGRISGDKDWKELRGEDGGTVSATSSSTSSNISSSTTTTTAGTGTGTHTVRADEQRKAINDESAASGLQGALCVTSPLSSMDGLTMATSASAPYEVMWEITPLFIESLTDTAPSLSRQAWHASSPIPSFTGNKQESAGGCSVFPFPSYCRARFFAVASSVIAHPPAGAAPRLESRLLLGASGSPSSAEASEGTGSGEGAVVATAKETAIFEDHSGLPAASTSETASTVNATAAAPIAAAAAFAVTAGYNELHIKHLKNEKTLLRAARTLPSLSFSTAVDINPSGRKNASASDSAFLAYARVRYPTIHSLCSGKDQMNKMCSREGAAMEDDQRREGCVLEMCQLDMPTVCAVPVDVVPLSQLALFNPQPQQPQAEAQALHSTCLLEYARERCLADASLSGFCLLNENELLVGAGSGSEGEKSGVWTDGVAVFFGEEGFPLRPPPPAQAPVHCFLKTYRLSIDDPLIPTAASLHDVLPALPPPASVPAAVVNQTRAPTSEYAEMLVYQPLGGEQHGDTLYFDTSMCLDQMPSTSTAPSHSIPASSSPFEGAAAAANAASTTTVTGSYCDFLPVREIVMWSGETIVNGVQCVYSGPSWTVPSLEGDSIDVTAAAVGALHCPPFTSHNDRPQRYSLSLCAPSVAASSSSSFGSERGKKGVQGKEKEKEKEVNEEVDKVVSITIRYGALVDSVSIRTAKGRELRVGGAGGEHSHTVRIQDNADFFGFYGGTGGHLHNLGVIMLTRSSSCGSNSIALSSCSSPRSPVAIPPILPPPPPPPTTLATTATTSTATLHATPPLSSSAACSIVLQGSNKLGERRLGEALKGERNEERRVQVWRALFSLAERLKMCECGMLNHQQHLVEHQRLANVGQLINLLSTVLLENSRDVAQTCIDAICSYLRNVLKDLREKKYQSVKLSNAFFQRTVGAAKGGPALFCFGPGAFQIRFSSESLPPASTPPTTPPCITSVPTGTTAAAAVAGAGVNDVRWQGGQVAGQQQQRVVISFESEMARTVATDPKTDIRALCRKWIEQYMRYLAEANALTN